MNIAYLWLIVGALFIAAEALGASGIGLLFAGLGAMVTGTAVHLGWVMEDARIAQFIIFFVSTAIWVAILWKPMQKFRLSQRSGGYSNIVGETAYVGSNGLNKRSGGEVTWSGTIMKAQLVKDASVEQLDAGAQVIITEVSGATLLVRPKE